MGLREQINQRPALVTRATVAVIVVALVVIVYQQWNFNPRTSPGRETRPGTERPVGDGSRPGGRGGDRTLPASYPGGRGGNGGASAAPAAGSDLEPRHARANNPEITA